jgi:transcriptional regulator with XRE-family HTH domain
MTQEQVAQLVGVHANYIGYLEKGARRPSDRTLESLCRVMQLDRRRVLLALRPAFRDVVVAHGAESGPPLPPALEELRQDAEARRVHQISDEDIRNLTCLDAFGHVRDKAGYLRVLRAIREVAVP